MFANFTNNIPFVSTFQSVPRFGHMQDITLLLRNDLTTVQLKDYIYGLLFIPLFIVVTFILWLLLSFILSCCCCGKSGFLGGKRFEPNKDETESKKCCTHARNSRITFLVSAILVIAFAATFSTMGIANVDLSLYTFSESIMDYHNLIRRGSGAANQITTEVYQAKVNRDQATTYLSKGQTMCSSTISPYIDLLNDSTSLDNFTADYSLTLVDAFDSLDVDTTSVDNLLQDIRDNRIWINYTVPIVVSFIVLIFMYGTISAWFGRTANCFEYFQNCFLLPILFIILMISISLAIVMGLINVPISDVCTAVEKVDPIINTFNNITNTQPGSLADRTVRYLLSGCSGNQTDPFAVIQTYGSELSYATILVSNATNFTIANKQNLTSICGVSSSDVNATILTLLNLTSTLKSLKKSLDEVQNVASCSSLYQLYDQTVHVAVCHYLVNGTGWLFVSTVVVSTFIMILITLRSTWRKNADHSDLS